MEFGYDVIVIGAGHAGCEAAHASARLGAKTLLVTIDLNKIARMSCNPAVGGIAKGQIVREIDAMGGAMGSVTDASTLQFRMLNRSKGPAMWSPRAQCDRGEYSAKWRSIVEDMPGLSLWQDEVTEILTDGEGRVRGIRTGLGVEFTAQAVILTAGTFLNGLIHIGGTQIPGGRVAEPAAKRLTESILRLGHSVERMKTGTPVRLDRRTIDFSLTETQEGDPEGGQFSFVNEWVERQPQLPCYICYTNEATHEVIRCGLPESPLYNGQIQSIGPRYCPSIETKIVTFPERTAHQLFIEPETRSGVEYYLNGFSSSLPIEIQIEALRTIPALRDVHVIQPGYAIEYDFFDPRDLRHTQESKKVTGLYMAGQVNGTTGYEEAAGQGLMAGINAARAAKGLEPIVLRRDEAYIGVLIDDLVTKGVDEPYRMFTSRAEHRIMLRQDNADERLTPIGRRIGLVGDDRWEEFRQKQEWISRMETALRETKILPGEANGVLEEVGSSPIKEGQRAERLLSRPDVTLGVIGRMSREIDGMLEGAPYGAEESLECRVKYAGYIERERLTVERMHRLEARKLGERLEYHAIAGLSTEARQKLERIRPETIAQASRIPGVSPSDVNILLLMTARGTDCST